MQCEPMQSDLDKPASVCLVQKSNGKSVCHNEDYNLSHYVSEGNPSSSYSLKDLEKTCIANNHTFKGSLDYTLPFLNKLSSLNPLVDKISPIIFRNGSNIKEANLRFLRVTNVVFGCIVILLLIIIFSYLMWVQEFNIRRRIVNEGIRYTNRMVADSTIDYDFYAGFITKNPTY